MLRINMLKNVLLTAGVAVLTLMLASYPAWLLVQWLEGWCLLVSGSNVYIATTAFSVLICWTFSSIIYYLLRGKETMPPNDVEEMPNEEIRPVYVPEGWRLWVRFAPTVIWILLGIGFLAWQDLGPQKCCHFHLPSFIGRAEAAESKNDCRRGYEYLANLTSVAAVDLQASGVRSISNPDMLVVDAVGQRAVIAPFVLENLSRDEFRGAKSEKAKANLICAVLSEYGRKGSRAFQNRSSGPYFGPAQMSGGMYNVLRGIYPAAGLITDSGRGRDNHFNMAKAIYLHHDATFKDLSAAAREKVGTGEWRNRAMIGTYNLKAEDISDAVTNHGKNWRFSSYKVVVKTKSGKRVTKTRYNPISQKTVVYLSMYVDGVYEVFKAFGQTNS